MISRIAEDGRPSSVTDILNLFKATYLPVAFSLALYTVPWAPETRVRLQSKFLEGVLIS